MIKFLNNIEDKEIKFAVIISRTNDGDGFFANIKKEIHLNFQEDIEKKGKRF